MKILKPESVNFDEKELQKLFEKNLDSIEEGLKYVSSFFEIGVGVIDTLAVDDDGTPVIIEFKIGSFDEDALIQLMTYYSWFAKDQNHALRIKNEIKRKTNVDNINEDDIRLMAVGSEIPDEVKNASWALEPRIKFISYSTSKDTNGETLVLPRTVLDTRSRERRVPEPRNLEDHFLGSEEMRPIYEELKKRILEIDQNINFNPAPLYYIGVSRKKVFCWISVKRKWLRVSLLLTQEEVGKSPRYTKEDEESGYIHVKSIKDIDDELMNWIRTAYNKAG